MSILQENKTRDEWNEDANTRHESRTPWETQLVIRAKPSNAGNKKLHNTHESLNGNHHQQNRLCRKQTIVTGGQGREIGSDSDGK